MASSKRQKTGTGEMGSNTNGGLTKHVANGFARSDVLLDESELVIPEELLDAGRG